MRIELTKDLKPIRVLLALRNLSSSNKGGPGAAARVLAQALIHLDKELQEDIHVALLENLHIRPLSDLNKEENIQPVIKRLHSKSYWLKLQFMPDSLLLNLMHGISLYAKSLLFPFWLRLHLRDDMGIIQSFIPNLTFVLARNRRRRYLVIHSDHSKGGWSREFSQLFPHLSESLLVKRMKRIEMEAIRSSDHIIFSSKGAYQLFREWHQEMWDIPESKISIIYTGIPDWMQQLGVSSNFDSPFLILNIAQHVPEKRLDRFIRGVNMFFERVPTRSESFVARNYGESTPFTRHLMAEYDVKAIEFRDVIPHPDLLKEIGRSWVIVSIPEVAVFDLVVLESMALGKPIIASNVGGNVEALGEDYPLYANDPDEIVEKLEHLLITPGLYHYVSKRNRQRFIDMFSQKTFVEKHIALWEALAIARKKGVG
ncbi:MAG: glycosyltransferase family 4 protein [Thermosphaera sp.]